MKSKYSAGAIAGIYSELIKGIYGGDKSDKIAAHEKRMIAIFENLERELNK